MQKEGSVFQFRFWICC